MGARILGARNTAQRGLRGAQRGAKGGALRGVFCAKFDYSAYYFYVKIGAQRKIRGVFAGRSLGETPLHIAPKSPHSKKFSGKSP